ncbi:hypothetical protein ACJX0J_024273, partial [Zea mays]
AFTHSLTNKGLGLFPFKIPCLVVLRSEQDRIVETEITNSKKFVVYKSNRLGTAIILGFFSLLLDNQSTCIDHQLRPSGQKKKPSNFYNNGIQIEVF